MAVTEVRPTDEQVRGEQVRGEQVRGEVASDGVPTDDVPTDDEVVAGASGRVFGAGGRRPVLVASPGIDADPLTPGVHPRPSRRSAAVRLGRVGDEIARQVDAVIAEGSDPAIRQARLAARARMAARVRPDGAAAGERAMPVPEALVPVVPGGGLQRGTVTAVTATEGVAGATALALALVSAASVDGAWCAAVGLDRLGWLAAVEAGVVLDRCIDVTAPDEAQWLTVVAALVDAVDVVLVDVPRRLGAREAQRLQGRARERGAALVLVPSASSTPSGLWPGAVDVALAVRESHWMGLGSGSGHLTGRRVLIEGSGRRAGARPRRHEVWLPHPDGGVRAVVDEASGGVGGVGVSPPLAAVG